MFWLKNLYTTVCLIRYFVQADFLDLEAVATDGHSTDDDEQQSDRALYLYFFIIFILILITFDR